MSEIDPIHRAVFAPERPGAKEQAPRQQAAPKQTKPQNQGVDALSFRLEALRTAPEDTSKNSVEQAEMLLSAVLGEVMGDGFAERRLKIYEDAETGRFVYQSVDKKTGEMIRQFPAQDILKMVAAIREAEGLVLDRTV